MCLRDKMSEITRDLSEKCRKNFLDGKMCRLDKGRGMGYNKQLKLEKKVCVGCNNDYHPWRSNQKNCDGCNQKRLDRGYADRWVSRKIKSNVRSETQVIRAKSF